MTLRDNSRAPDAGAQLAELRNRKEALDQFTLADYLARNKSDLAAIQQALDKNRLVVYFDTRTRYYSSRAELLEHRAHLVNDPLAAVETETEKAARNLSEAAADLVRTMRQQLAKDLRRLADFVDAGR